MLISTKMTGIQCHLLHNVRVDQSQSPYHRHSCQSYLSQSGLPDHLSAHLLETCLSERGMSETLSETISELHMSEPYLSEPHLLELHLLGSYLSQPELSDQVGVHLSEQWLLELALSELHFWELYVSEPHLSKPELSVTKSEYTFIVGFIRNHFIAILDRAILISLKSISEPRWLKLSGDTFQVVFAEPISWERHQAYQKGQILHIHQPNEVMFSRCTVPLVD